MVENRIMITVPDNVTIISGAEIGLEAYKQYEDVIRETNETLVPKEQVLSDHLYIYERGSGTLKSLKLK